MLGYGASGENGSQGKFGSRFFGEGAAEAVILAGPDHGAVFSA